MESNLRGGSSPLVSTLKDKDKGGVGMQTFLPYKSFQRSAEVLDRARLGKQRVENMQIAMALVSESGTKTGWKYHPAVKMWRGHEMALMAYQVAICNEWTSRGYKDTCLEKTRALIDKFIEREGEVGHNFEPSWLGDEEFHKAHQSNLLRKKPEHYEKFFTDVPDDLPYVWPV